MSSPESYPTRLLSGEVQRMLQYLEMGSTDVALSSDADVQRCLHLLTGTSNVSSENGRTGDTSLDVPHRFRSPHFVGKGSFGIVFIVFDPTLQMPNKPTRYSKSICDLITRKTGFAPNSPSDNLGMPLRFVSSIVMRKPGVQYKCLVELGRPSEAVALLPATQIVRRTACRARVCAIGQLELCGCFTTIR